MVVEEFNRKLLNCTKCNYQWFSTSKLRWVSCPNCGSKNRTTPIETIIDDCEIIVKEDATNEKIVQIPNSDIREN